MGQEWSVTKGTCAEKRDGPGLVFKWSDLRRNNFFYSFMSLGPGLKIIM